ncbi:hypothetical protein CEXT_723941, partial [Caerostris extrusa]
PQKSDNKDKNGAHSGSRSPPRQWKNEKRTRSRSPQPKNEKRMRSRSPQPKKKKRAHSKSSSPDIEIIKEQKMKKQYDVPIRIYGDLYCEFCDAHMN